MILYRGTSTEALGSLKNLAPISPISIYKKESEVLFNAGQEMFIMSAEMKNGVLNITVLVE